MVTVDNYTCRAAERWDNYSSAMSDPICILRSFIEERRTSFVEIPRKVWKAAKLSPSVVDAMDREPRTLPSQIVLLFGLVRIDRTRLRTDEERLAAVLGLPPGGVRFVDGNGPVRVGDDFEIHGTIREDA